MVFSERVYWKCVSVQYMEVGARRVTYQFPRNVSLADEPCG